MLTPGNTNEFTAFFECFKGFLARMERLSWRGRLAGVAADKGYDSRRIRRFLRRRGLVPVIPKRRTKEGKRTRNPGFDRATYRGRNVVERCLSWLKEQRRVATRYDKLAATYSTMVQLSFIRRLLPCACAA
jgi:Transposase and inactivated derivatives